MLEYKSITKDFCLFYFYIRWIKNIGMKIYL